MKQLMGALGRGVNGSSILVLIAAAGVCWLVLGGIPGVNWLGIWAAILTGLVAGMIIGKSTEYYTSYDFKPTRSVAQSSETGHATVIISGIAEGMKSTWASILTVIVAIMAAYSFAGGFENTPLGLYGVGIAAVAMLSTLGITLATDAYGPIADNAGGNAEMTGQDPEVRERTDALDSLGNTTAAIGKGFAIGSAALTALALLAAYVEEVRVGQQREGRAAFTEVHQDAMKTEDAGVGSVVSVGNGKLVMKPEAGTGKFDVMTVMALDHRDRVKTMEDSDFENVQLLNMEETLGLGHYHLTFPDVMVETKNIRTGQTVQRPLTVHGVTAKYATLDDYMEFYGVTLMNPKVLGGLFAGVMLVFLFSAMTMKAVGRAANSMVKEVRRQFKEIPGIMEGTGQPDYARCVAISTAGAQKEMVVPSMMALVVPVLVGLLLDVPGVLGLLAGGLTCGFAVAIFMANAGGAWDNAKKYIETGELGGKGSENHKATVTGDTVGDPFKDTSGPSLNILIKLMSMVSVVFAGLIVKYAPMIADMLGMN
jgi:inorganic pyrophosphatase/K(+)-stimulated pyrophosphate-energized sodium pump